MARSCDGIGVQVDVGDESAVAAAVGQVAEELGAPRIVQALDRSFTRTLRVNRVGTYMVLSHTALAMEGLYPIGPDGARGVIVNTASVAWQDG